MREKLSKEVAVAIVSITGIVSFCIGNIGLDHDKMGLGALANFIVLPILLSTALVIFILIDWALPKYRFGVLIGVVLLMIWLGIQLRIDSI